MEDDVFDVVKMKMPHTGPRPGWVSSVVGAGVARDQFAFLSSFVQIFDGENKYLERWTNTWYFNTCKNSPEVWNHENPKEGVNQLNTDGNEAMRHHKANWFCEEV